MVGKLLGEGLLLIGAYMHCAGHGYKKVYGEINLYSFQQKTLDDTAKFNRVAYYFDMGLGKTFIGGEKICQLDEGINLLVCQKSKIGDWIGHFKKFYPLWVVFNLTSKKQLAKYIDIFNRYGEFSGHIIGIVNYDLVFRRKELLTLENFTLCLDESSIIQNPQTQRTKAILKMTPSNVILLSGTPTGGKYENLYSQLRLLGWDISLKAFEQNYINWKKIEVGGFFHKVVDKENPYKNVERLKRKMREHGAVFIKTEEVYELPAQNFVQIKVKTTKEYRKFQKTSIVDIDGRTLVGDSILSKRIYSRMLCGQYNAEKLKALRDICESTNDRLIVFYNFDGELHALREICGELERPVSEINGHGKDLTAYRNEPDSITLIQYKAGARGENLQLSNKIIYFTLTDEAELFMQSLKRTHRIGQEKPCFYWILLCENSIEDNEILPTLGIRERYTNALFEK